MKHRSRTNFELCYICNAQMPKFATTPILELPDETWEPCCELCAKMNVSYAKSDIMGEILE